MFMLTSGADSPAPPPEPPDGPRWCIVCGKASSGPPDGGDTRKCPYCQNKLVFQFPPRPRP